MVARVLRKRIWGPDGRGWTGMMVKRFYKANALNCVDWLWVGLVLEQHAESNIFTGCLGLPVIWGRWVSERNRGVDSGEHSSAARDQ